MSEAIVETGFMLTMGSTDDEIAENCRIMVKESVIHAALWCPQPNGEGEWSVSIRPIGRIVSAGMKDGIARIEFLTLGGEIAWL